jgi:hypothetical protein
MKKCLVIVFVFAFGFASLVTAHSGRTDSSGGHTNHSTGVYHYHISGSSSSGSSSSSYSGNCACPYDIASDGSNCGARSAWSKSGGKSPVCYTTEDVPKSFDEWFWVASNVANNNYYLDISSIKKIGGYVYYWELDDLSEPIITQSGSRIYSAKKRLQVNCNDDSTRIRTAHYYTGNLGKGEFWGTDNTTQNWFYPPPRTTFNTLMEFVCDYVN